MTILPVDPRPRLLGSPVILTCLHCHTAIPTSRDTTAGRARLCRTCEAAATVVAQRAMTAQAMREHVGLASLLRPGMPVRNWPDA